MDQDRVKEIVAAAREMSPSAAEAYVAAQCKDNPDLLVEVQSLRNAMSKAERAHFLIDPTSGDASAITGVAPVPEGPGSLVGPYKLLEQIGEGGFGLVFHAEQLRPIVRRVALKVIKVGMDTRAVIARFEAERQALAMMDHPNIALVADAGATDSGRPYFVMELVKGEPITAYADRHHLGIKERLTSISRDGTRIALWNRHEETVRVCDTTGKFIGHPIKCGQQVWKATLSPDGSTVITKSTPEANTCDPTYRFWSSEGEPLGQPIFVPTTDARGRDALFSADGTRVLIPTLRGGDLMKADASLVTRISCADPVWWYGETFCLINNDTTRIAIADHLFDPSGRLLGIQGTSNPASVTITDFMAGGAMLVMYVGEDNTRYAIVDQSCFDDPIQDIDSALAAATLDDEKLLARDLPDLKQTTASAKDGAWTATIQSDGSVLVTRPRQEPIVVAHGENVLALAASPDGHRLVTASRQLLRFYDTRRWREVLTVDDALTLSQDAIIGLRFSPDGTRLVLCSGESITLWDTRTPDKRLADRDGIFREHDAAMERFVADAVKSNRTGESIDAEIRGNSQWSLARRSAALQELLLQLRERKEGEAAKKRAEARWAASTQPSVRR